MAVPEPALAKIQRFCERRTPPKLRDQMRLEATTRGNSVTIADCRPLWQGAPGEWTRLPIAQLRYQPTTQRWTLYWADRNDRWHSYEDLDPTTDLDTIIREIDQDPTCIFFG
ncbi:MAG TPA: DUF3024 domain-containing protein [Acidimicrobiales bacterium]|jgi:hypothetical protein|nr:DUF3024 domain-containing protein [Acidimicrobiales bacterium]